MTFVTAPNIIEVNDFNIGYSPDSEPAALEPGAILDSYNVFPDKEGGALVAREGFKRIAEEVLGGGTHTIIQLTPWGTNVAGTATKYLLCYLSTGTSAANNVRIYAINLSTLAATRIDDAGVNWDNPLSYHWGMGIEGVWYGGSKGNEMYSWNPDGPTWDGTAATGAWLTVVDGVDASIATGTQYGRDYAFSGKEKVFYNTKVFQANRSIRYDTWESGQRYVRGDRISRQAAWGHSGTPKYWKSFRCIETHVADSTNKPGDGADTATYWKKVRLPLPQDDSGDTATTAWNFVPTAPETHIAVWHSNRLWMRADGYGTKGRIMYSAPVRPKKGEDIAGVVFDPKDFAPGGDLQGPGGGWIPFQSGRGSGSVQALRSFGQYLLVFGARNLWVVSGESEESFTVRRVSHQYGTMGADSHVELNGLVYFLDGDDGLMVTDGTSVEPVPGHERIQAWLRARLGVIRADLADEATEVKGQLPRLFTWDGYVWVTLSTSTGSEDNLTLVYDPRTGSFWKTNLPVQDVAQISFNATARLYFIAPSTYSTRDLVYQYAHASATDLDDTGVDVYAGTAVTWYARIAWWPFGLLHEQRRIRRVWALVRGAATVTIAAYRNWVESEVATQATVVSSTTPVFIEGETFQDSHSVSFKISGTARPASLYGVAVDTQFRRQRYHT